MTSKENLKNRFISEYERAVEQFRDELLSDGIQPDIYQGMPEPHLPIVGKTYYEAKYQLAFYGIDTYGWGDLPDFLNKAKKSIEDAILSGQSSLDNQECLGWVNNSHNSFWDFIFQFLAVFYHVPLNEIMEKQHPEIIQSFVWGNTNAIERYTVSAQGAGVSEDIYDKVKRASKIFDGASRIINSVNPKVIIVLNWSEAEEWLTAFKDKTNVLKQELNDHFIYYYLRDSNTHIFWTAHPRWLSMKVGFKEQIQMIVGKFKEFNIWNELPPEQYTSLPTKEDIPTDKSSMEYKRGLIAKLATFLTETNTVISGGDLANIFNRNGIRSQYGEEYDPHGRGIYVVIKKTWEYFHGEKNDGSMAYNIARSFTNAAGEYAYD
ncbi:MAG: hypothetical protein LUC86_00520 [Prevotellaceae bacterium]|nr:hypothetical protein [Prevotellaceae bacterium]